MLGLAAWMPKREAAAALWGLPKNWPPKGAHRTAFGHPGAAPPPRAAGAGRRAARGLCDGRTDLAGQRGQGAARPLPACPPPWRSHRASLCSSLLWPNREQVSDRAIEGSGEAGVSLKVLYLDQNLHMLQPGWDSAALPIVLSRVEA